MHTYLAINVCMGRRVDVGDGVEEYEDGRREENIAGSLHEDLVSM